MASIEELCARGVLPIVTPSRCFDGYEPVAIRPCLRRALEAHQGPYGVKTIRPLVLQLECFLQITGKTLALADLESPYGLRTIRMFVSALNSNLFDEVSVYTISAKLRAILHSLGKNEILSDFPLQPKSTTGTEIPAYVFLLEQGTLAPDRIAFWQGWTIRNSKGKPTHLRLFELHEALGSDFTRTLHNAASAYHSARTADSMPGVNDLARFIVSNLPPKRSKSFKDPLWLAQFFSDYFVYFFVQAHSRKVNVTVAKRQWREFCNFANTHLVGRAWAVPSLPIPQPTADRPRGLEVKIKVSTNGTLVKESLLTTVPLSATDTEAAELLFSAIERDLSTVTSWARAEVELANERYTRRVLEGKSLEQPSSLSAAFSRFNRDGMPTPRTLHHYPRPLDKTAIELGLPNNYVLLSFAAALVAAHPQITGSFLQGLKLSKAGTAYVDLDGRPYLVGHKPRRGPTLSRQQILLTDATRELVDQLTRITAPLRLHLKKTGSTHQDKLFLSVSSLGAMPRPIDFAKAAFTEAPRLREGLLKATRASDQDATTLAARFSLARLRNSAAISVYLATGSVRRMSEALGHETYLAPLLDHYLPKSIQQFFVERWIRIFQTAFLCEAMRDSPNLLRAASFRTMDDLHSFLSHSALKTTVTPKVTTELTRDRVDRVIFGVNRQVLSVLIAIERAVDAATTAVHERAEMWASISKKLVPHVARLDAFSGLVDLAKHDARSISVEHLIYAN